MKSLVASALVALALLPSTVLAQAPTAGFGGDTRARVFVYLAFAAAWIIIGAWVWRIGAKLRGVVAEVGGER